MLDTVGKFVLLIIIISSKVKKLEEEERGEEIRGMELMILIIETGHFIFGNSSSQNLGLVRNKNRNQDDSPERFIKCRSVRHFY